MKKSHALIFALAITLLIAANISLINSYKTIREKATILRIIDGDTIELSDKRKIRLLNINVPEKNQAGHELAENYLKDFLNKTIELEITGSDKYNRVLARIYLDEYINLELVEKGYSSKFLVDESELKLFSNAEKNAIDSSLGMWQKSQYYGCIKSEIEEKMERVILSSNCNKVNISSWILKDESRKNYHFKSLELVKITLHSLEGTDNSTDLFWNSKTNIWNNDRDTLYLFDREGKIVHYNFYGY